MVRGRRPRPTAVNERSGTYRKNPKERNQREPQPPKGAPRKPAVVKIDEHASNAWDELVLMLGEMNVLAKTDRPAMIAYAVTYAEFVKAYTYVRDHGHSFTSPTGNQTVSAESHTFNKLSDRLLKMLIEFGLTPAARSRLKTAEPAKDENPISELMARFQGVN